MLRRLGKLESSGKQIRVGIVGCGAMGRGMARQVARIPGLRCALMADKDEQAILEALSVSGLSGVDFRRPVDARDAGTVPVVVGSSGLLADAISAARLDVLVECTNTIYDAFIYARGLRSNPEVMSS